MILVLKYGLYDLIDYFVEVYLLDGAKASSYITFDIACDNVTLHQAGL